MHPPFSIRVFNDSDMDAVLHVEHASFSKDAYDRNLFAEFSHKCGDLFLVAEGDGLICGYSITCIRSRGGTRMAQLISLAVLPAVRRAGVASALMRRTLRQLRLRSVSRCTLTVKVTNLGACEFYRRHGFRRLRVERRYYEDGKDGWLMVLDLPTSASRK